MIPTPIQVFERREKERHRPSAIIHCNYVYGIGHFVRMVELARGLSDRFDMYLLNGGEPVPNYNIPAEISCLQIPAIYSEEMLQQLRPVDRSMDLRQCYAMRSAMIADLVSAITPDLLITEHFPFGPLFESEVLSLISHVKTCNPRSKVVSSVRDIILAEGGGARDAYTCSLLNHWYDLVLVHGDPRIVPFTTSFPLAREIQIPCHYTGYIVKSIQPVAPPRDLPILLVSVGGGRMGGELLYRVLEAHEAIAHQWHHQLVMFTGAFQQDAQRLNAYLHENGLRHVTVRQFDEERYRQTLAAASAVICMGGYNSLLEAVSLGRPVLIYNRVFYGNNQEQNLRMARFEQAGLVHIINSDDLTPTNLAKRVVDTVMNWRRVHLDINVNGIVETRKVLERILG
jgi:predicted glycosyltransferase